MSDIDKIIKSGQDDTINQAFRDGATLNIRLNGEGYIHGQPYIQLGLTRFYFATKEPQVEEPGIIKYTLDYDGWEKSVGHLNIEVEEQ